MNKCDQNNFYEIYSYKHSTVLHCYKQRKPNTLKESLMDLHIYYFMFLYFFLIFMLCFICTFLYNHFIVNILIFQVVTLSPDNLLVIRQAGSVLEDVNAVINKITNLAHCNIKLLSSAVIASDTVRNDAVNKKVDDRQLPNFKSMKESKNSLLQLVVYGLDNQTKPVSYSDIKK